MTYIIQNQKMPAKDTYHDAVKNALIKDGWKIIVESYFLQYEDAQVYADLLAEKALLAEQNNQRIVVEIKSFINPSPIRDFEFNTFRLSPKQRNNVGWVEERNPTFTRVCWVSLRSTQPTKILNRTVLILN